jgi:hypothetical protein
MKHFWNSLHQVSLKSKIKKSNKLKVFGSKKTKEPKQDSLNCLRSANMPDGSLREPKF